MTHYIEFPIEGGGAILIETPDEPEKAKAGFVKGAPVREAAEQAQQSFDASVENVRKSADLLVQKLRALSQTPDEMIVAFSLKATGEYGNLAVGRVGAEANFNVTLKWRHDEKEDGGKKKEEANRDDAGKEDAKKEEKSAEGDRP